MVESRPLLGLSSCLQGDKVRFDGGHKHDHYITGTLSRYFDFHTICPEVGIGMGVPRPTIRLVQGSEGLRVRGVKDPELDVTERLQRFSSETVAQLEHLSGYILKKGSPSCGMERVKVYGENGYPAGKGSGLFAAELMERFPLLPVEEEGRLGDPALRENFITRVFVYHHWQRLYARGITPANLIEFHSDHKYLIMAHNQAAYRRMGKMLADAGNADLKILACLYAGELMGALRRIARPHQHVNVLQHLLGYLRRQLDAEDRAEMVEIIEQYRQGVVPLIVPITLLKHHFRRHPHPYIARQVYLTPHPQELMLRNQL